VDKIKDSWLIPAIIRSESGRTTILFYIEKDGQISGLRVVAESGNRRLDSAALNSVLVAGPFPPLPRDFSGEHIGAKLVFSYNEVRIP
jgi:protein TonB